SKLLININEKEISKCLNQFKELENSLSSIEHCMNIFLLEINLKSQIRIIVSEDQKKLFINLIFVRKEDTQITFEELTTPEKIFFIIVLYVSINLQIKKSNIIFSNISLSSQYNKAGSIYRTIRKILPIFERDAQFSDTNLIFIISKLEIKKQIKNLNIITIKES
ncbi:MAG: hypothetical protein ACFFDF_07145, partial [Candidatus Odinarchaeota archaeon]